MGDELRSTITDEALDRQLRDALPYVDDAGFTARVLSKLPPQRHARQSLRATVLIALTIIGSALAYVLSDSGRFVVVNLVRLANLPPLALVSLTFGVGLVAIAAALVTGVTKLRETAA